MESNTISSKFKNEMLANDAENHKNIIVNNMPVKLTIHTNKNCNLNCGFCGYSSKQTSNPNDIMSLDTLNLIASEIFPTSNVVIPTTYGEPLIYPYFDEFIEKVRHYRNRLSMYTNGDLLIKNRIISIMDILNDIKISFDGATRETYEKIRNLSNYERVFDNVKLFLKLRKEIKFLPPPSLTFQYTLMKSNINELPEFVKIISELGADRLAVSHVYSFHPNKDYEMLIDDQDNSNEMLSETKLLTKKYGIDFFYPRKYGANIDAEFSSIFSKNTCSYLYQETWIDAQANVRPCFFPDGPVLGNIKNSSFSEIWNGEGYQEMRRTVNADKPYFDRCSKCPIKMQFSNSIDLKYDKSGFIMQKHNIQLL